jgi:hypothetical protein
MPIRGRRPALVAIQIRYAGHLGAMRSQSLPSVAQGSRLGRRALALSPNPRSRPRLALDPQGCLFSLSAPFAAVPRVHRRSHINPEKSFTATIPGGRAGQGIRPFAIPRSRVVSTLCARRWVSMRSQPCRPRLSIRQRASRPCLWRMDRLGMAGLSGRGSGQPTQDGGGGRAARQAPRRDR